MKKEEPSGKKCFNKLCNSKKIYKKLRSKVEHAKYRFFCRQCYESYYNNDFCEFCEQIYSSTANSDDDDQWIGCDSCTRWVSFILFRTTLTVKKSSEIRTLMK